MRSLSPRRRARPVPAVAALLALAAPPMRAVDPRPPAAPHIWYVDNTAGSDGDGSMVAPFERLSRAVHAAEAGDTIYVFRGDGSDRGLDDGIRLRPRQHLVGAGVAFAPDGGAGLAAGEPPLLDGGSGPAVVLADGASVEGFTLEGGGAVVVGQHVAAVRLAHLRVDGRGTAEAGVRLEEVRDATLEAVTITDALHQGLLSVASGGVVLRGCHLEHRGHAEGDAALLLREPGGETSITDGELLATGGAALRVDAAQATGRLALQKVTLAADGGTALQVEVGSAAVLTLTARDSELRATETGALLSASGGARLVGTLENDRVGGKAAARGIVVLLGDHAEAALTLAANHLAGQRAEAVYGVAASTARLGLDAHDNEIAASAVFTAAPLPSLLVETRDGATACVALRNNQVGDGSGGGPAVALKQVGDSDLALVGFDAAAAEPAGQRLAAANRLGRVEIEMRPGRALASAATLHCPALPGLPATAVAQN